MSKTDDRPSLPPGSSPQSEAVDLAPNIEPTATENLAEAAATLAQLIPGVGGFIASVVSGAVNERRNARLGEELRRLHDELKDQKEKVKTEYLKTEEFTELLMETLGKMALELDPEKRALYRHYLRNLMIEPPGPYSDQRKVLRLAEELSPAHVLIIDAIGQTPEPNLMRAGVIAAPIQVLLERTKSRTKLSSNEAIQIVKDLEADGLVTALHDSLTTMLWPNAALDLSGRLTPLGRRVRQFLKS